MVRIRLLVHIYRSSTGAASGIQTLADRIEDQVVHVFIDRKRLHLFGSLHVEENNLSAASANEQPAI
jgi:hypothetical protein